jgi:hypothetical protein
MFPKAEIHPIVFEDIYIYENTLETNEKENKQVLGKMVNNRLYFREITTIPNCLLFLKEIPEKPAKAANESMGYLLKAN